MRFILMAGLADGFLGLSVAPAYANYSVYCARGRIEVDSRNLQQMRSARGSGVCQMGPTSRARMDAMRLADRNFGGRGASCSCR